MSRLNQPRRSWWLAPPKLAESERGLAGTRAKACVRQDACINLAIQPLQPDLDLHKARFDFLEPL